MEDFNVDQLISFKDVLINNQKNALFNNPNISEIFIVNHNALKAVKGLKKIKFEIQIINFIKQKKFDAVICTFPHDRFLLWSYFSKAKIRIGQAGQAFSFLLSNQVKKTKEDSGVLNYYLELVKDLGVKAESYETEFFPSEESKTWAEKFIAGNNLKIDNQKLIAIHPGASGNYKIWPPENFAVLIKKIISNKNMDIILCFGNSDLSIVNQIKNIIDESIHKKLIYLNTGNDLDKLSSLFKKCDLVVTNDSGPRHLAVASGSPNLTLFRKYHDKAWKIYPENNFTSTIQSQNKCNFCNENECNDKIPPGEIFGSYCMREIGVDDVFDKVNELSSQ